MPQYSTSMRTSSAWKQGALDGHRLEAVENGAGGPVRFGRNDFHRVRGKKRTVKKGVTTSVNDKKH